MCTGLDPPENSLNLVSSINVSVTPRRSGSMATVSIINSTSADLTVPYNNLYTVNVFGNFCDKISPKLLI